VSGNCLVRDMDGDIYIDKEGFMAKAETVDIVGARAHRVQCVNGQQLYLVIAGKVSVPAQERRKGQRRQRFQPVVTSTPMRRRSSGRREEDF